MSWFILDRNLTAELSSVKAKSSSLTEERDQLNSTLIEVTKERDRLQSLSERSEYFYICLDNIVLCIWNI